MDFIEVANGLENGKVYQRKGWSSDNYLVKDKYGNIKEYDYKEIKDFELTTENILAVDWVECKKQLWTIVNSQRDYGLYNDRVYLYYQLETKIDYIDTSLLVLSSNDIKEWVNYIDIKVNEEDVSLTDTEKTELYAVIN